jgi:hypothetical protein
MSSAAIARMTAGFSDAFNCWRINSVETPMRTAPRFRAPSISGCRTSSVRPSRE